MSQSSYRCGGCCRIDSGFSAANSARRQQADPERRHDEGLGGVTKIDISRQQRDELEQELDGSSAEAIQGEMGDLLFAVANLARHARVDAEAALRATNEKFRRRFAFIEALLSINYIQVKVSVNSAIVLAYSDGSLSGPYKITRYLIGDLS